MRKWKNSKQAAVWLAALFAFVLANIAGCEERNAGGLGNLSPGVVIEPSDLVLLRKRTAHAVASAPTKIPNGGGLVGVVGGAHVKLRKTGIHEVLLSMPQLTGTQTPVCYAITTTPREAGTEYRLRMRDESNAIVSVQLKGNRNEDIQIAWSSIVLVTDRSLSPDRVQSERYLQQTACVQSEAKQVRALADKLWPASGRIEGYAANIQDFIHSMKQEKRPRSLDALGILDSGGNWICTANANLAVALLRSKHLPSRSIAVIPPNGQRLEMHRIVEYFDGGQWHRFDPSMLHKNIPMKPWQSVVMARTTIADEDIAMKPRIGTALGCPYGQELEFHRGKLTFSGQDFFWTMGKLLAEFEAGDEAVHLARTEWDGFMKTGKLSQRQWNAAAARSLTEFLEALRSK